MEKRGKAERGLSLIEVLVSTAVMSVVVLVALLVTTPSTFARASATERQESVASR
jgi:prepilin-type N-terminal cleavage/methylation domain-containing protein